MAKRRGKIANAMAKRRGKIANAMVNRGGRIDNAIAKRRGGMANVMAKIRGRIANAMAKRRGRIDNVMAKRRGRIDNDMAKRERTDNNLQNNTTRIPQKSGGDLRWSGRVSSYCSINDISRVTLVKNPVVRNELGKDRIVITIGAYPWSFVPQIFRNS